MKQPTRKEFLTLPLSTSITRLRELCGWNRDRQDGDFELVSWSGCYRLQRDIKETT